ncbi:MAG: hypothetical protein IJ366_02275 [Clostridia bacterium]|nr:hypothetical protein [Clostridia bacterium]
MSQSSGFSVFDTDIAKLAAIALAGTLLAVLLRRENPAFATVCAFATAAAMALYILPDLGGIFTGFISLFEDGGISPEYYKSVIKVIGVAYFTEIVSSLCRDAGENAIGTKLELAGKVIALSLTIPAVTQLMTVIKEALSLI